jgi:prephenate dehydratase
LILKDSKRIQKKGQPLIAFQGEYGEFNAFACQYWNNKVLPISCADFTEIFTGIEKGIYEYGLIPIENMSEEIKGQIHSLMLHAPLYIVGEIQIPLHYYDLEVISADVEDEIEQARFLILSKTPYKKRGNKCSILFSVAEQEDSLMDILELFSKAKINLTRMDSVPWKKEVNAFFVDFMGNEKDATVQQILTQIEKKTQLYRFLGCYPQKVVVE